MSTDCATEVLNTNQESVGKSWEEKECYSSICILSSNLGIMMWEITAEKHACETAE